MRSIDADALKKAIGDLYGLPFEEMVEDFTWLNAIDNAPTVCGNNPKWCESCVSKGKCASTRPQGEWKPKLVTFGTCFLQGFECECGRIVMQKENFCPDCGARMEFKEEQKES